VQLSKILPSDILSDTNALSIALNMTQEQIQRTDKVEQETESMKSESATQRAKRGWSGHSFVPQDLEYMDSYDVPKIIDKRTK